MCSRLQFERNSDRTVLRAVCLYCGNKWVVKDDDFVFDSNVRDTMEMFGNPWDRTILKTEGDPWTLSCNSCGTEGVVSDLRIRPIRTFKPTTSCFEIFDPKKDLGLLNKKKWMSSTWRTFWKAYEAKGLSKDGKNTMSIKDACRKFKDLNSLYRTVKVKEKAFQSVLDMSNLRRPVKPLMEEFMGLDNPLYLSRSVMDLVSKRVGIVLIHDYSHASREIRNRWDLRVPSDRMWYDNNEDILNGPEFSMNRGKPHIPEVLPNGEMNRKGLWVQWDAKKKHHIVFDEGMTLVGYDGAQGEDDDSYNPYEDYEEVLNNPETTEEDLQEAADSYFKSIIE